MARIYQSSRSHCWLFLFLFLFLSSMATAAEKSGFAGWEVGSTYNSYYNAKERDSLKGEIVQFKEVTPLAGMDPGTAFILQEGEEKILVHLCPIAFRTAEETGLRRGTKTKVKGCWALIDGQDVFMAAKVKQGESFEFKVRLTKDGTPFWSMSPEDLAKETDQQ